MKVGFLSRLPQLVLFFAAVVRVVALDSCFGLAFRAVVVTVVVGTERFATLGLLKHWLPSMLLKAVLPCVVQAWLIAAVVFAERRFRLMLFRNSARGIPLLFAAGFCVVVAAFCRTGSLCRCLNTSPRLTKNALPLFGAAFLLARLLTLEWVFVAWVAVVASLRKAALRPDFF